MKTLGHILLGIGFYGCMFMSVMSLYAGGALFIIISMLLVAIGYLGYVIFDEAIEKENKEAKYMRTFKKGVEDK